MRLLLRNGRLVDPASKLDSTGDLLVADGVIHAIGPSITDVNAHVIELDGAWVCPGFIDMHSVVRDERDVQAALNGGFTTVIAAPESPKLRTDLLELLPASALTRNLEGQELGEVPDTAVCLSQGFKPIARAGVLRRALQYSASRGKLIVVHAEDPSLTGVGVIGEGLTATRLGLPTVPDSAESSVIARDLEILAETGGRLHFAHVTTERGLSLIRAAKARSLEVSCDVTPHHLTGDTRLAEGYALEARVWPPLRSERDVAALRAGLADGTVDAIACDHVRVDILEREHPFEACAPGCESFEQAVPAAWALGLPAARLVELFSAGPARLLGLPSGLGKGRAARLSIIDASLAKARGVVIGTQHTLHFGTEGRR